MGDGLVDERPCSEQRTTTGPVGDVKSTPRDGQVRCGERLGRYIVGSRVGMGGGGAVYSAYDDALLRPVALKVLWRGAHDLEAPSREAQAIAELDHPNIVTVYDMGVDRGRAFVVMELVDGGSLRDWLEHARPTPARIVAMMMQAARGLAHAHDRGLVHRDFKLDNVLVSRQGRVLVTDFGLATRRGVVPSQAMAGTLPYMAPEQHRGEAVDHAADQFALCVGLFHALHGFPPFSGESAEEIYAAKRSGTMEPIDHGVVGRRVHRVITRGLSARPADRFASMHDLIAAAEGRGYRRWIPASILPIALGGAWLATPSPSPSSPSPSEGCDDAPVLWSREDADRVREALRATGTRFAASTGERVDQMLSAYAREWSRSRTHVCERMIGASKPQQSALEAIEGCLHRARLRMNALTTALGQAERNTAGYATQAAELLPSPARCLHRPQPLGRWDDPAWVALESELALAQVHGVLGSFEAASDRAERIVSAAEALTAPELVPRAWLLRGQSEIELAHHDEGQRALELAHYRAVALGDDDIAMEAAVELLWVAVRDRADLGMARRWNRTARAIAARSRPYPDLEAILLHARAEHANAAGDAPGWVELHRQALEIRRRDDEPSLSLAESLESFARALLYTNQVESSLPLFEDALEIRQDLLGEEHPWLAVAHNNYGVALALAGQQERAREHLDAGLRVLEVSLGPEHPRVGRALTNLGQFTLARGEIAVARAYLTRAVSILVASSGREHRETLAARENLVRALGLDGQPDQALALALAMLADAEAGASPPVVLITLHATLGWAQLRVDDHAAALESYREALALVDDTSMAEVQRPNFWYGVAQAHVGLHQDEHGRLVAERARAQASDEDLQSKLAYLLAGIEVRRGRHDEALALARASRDALPSWARADTRRVRALEALLEQIHGMPKIDSGR